MSVPPVFPKSWYVKLAGAAKKFGFSRVEFATRAIKFYEAELGQQRSPVAKELGSSELAKEYSELSSKIAKSWWSRLTPEQRRARAQHAVQARWDKAKAKAKKKPKK